MLEIFLSALLKISINFLVIFALAFVFSSIVPFSQTVFYFAILLLLIASAEMLRFIWEAFRRRQTSIQQLEKAESVRQLSESLHNDFRSNLRRPFNNLHNRDHILSLFINSIAVIIYFSFPFSKLGSDNAWLNGTISLAVAVLIALVLSLTANLLANFINNGVYTYINKVNRPLFTPLIQSWKITENSLNFDVKNAEFSTLFGLSDLTPDSLAEIIFFVDLDKREKMIKVLQRVKAPEAAATIARFMELYPARHGFAVSALIKCKDRAIEPLKKLLQHRDTIVKQAAMNALAGINTPEAIAALVEMLKDGDVEVKRAAIWDLNENNSHWIQGPSGGRAKQILLRSLNSCDTEERAFAAWALGMIKDKDAAPFLKELLQDSHALVRENAVFALGELRELFVQDDIEKILNDNDSEVRKSALIAMRKINPERASHFINRKG